MSVQHFHEFHLHGMIRPMPTHVQNTRCGASHNRTASPSNPTNSHRFLRSGSALHTTTTHRSTKGHLTFSPLQSNSRPPAAPSPLRLGSCCQTPSSAVRHVSSHTSSDPSMHHTSIWFSNKTHPLAGCGHVTVTKTPKAVTCPETRPESPQGRLHTSSTRSTPVPPENASPCREEVPHQWLSWSFV